MRKILLFVMTAILVQNNFAQSGYGFEVSDFEGQPKSNVLFIGPKIGGSLSSIAGQPSEVDLFDGGSFGFSGGLALRTRFGRATENSYAGTGMFGVGLELKYRQTKAKTIADKNLSLGYFEVPVLLQVFPMASSSSLNGLYIEAGPDFAILMSKSPDVLSLNLKQPFPGLESVSYHTKDLKGGDCRIAVGIGYTVPNTGLDINARYYFGMSELAKDTMPCKMNFFEFSLSWLFNVVKF